VATAVVFVTMAGAPVAVVVSVAVSVGAVPAADVVAEPGAGASAVDESRSAAGAVKAELVETTCVLAATDAGWGCALDVTNGAANGAETTAMPTASPAISDPLGADGVAATRTWPNGVATTRDASCPAIWGRLKSPWPVAGSAVTHAWAAP